MRNHLEVAEHSTIDQSLQNLPAGLEPGQSLRILLAAAAAAAVGTRSQQSWLESLAVVQELVLVVAVEVLAAVALAMVPGLQRHPIGWKVQVPVQRQEHRTQTNQAVVALEESVPLSAAAVSVEVDLLHQQKRLDRTRLGPCTCAGSTNVSAAGSGYPEAV